MPPPELGLIEPVDTASEAILLALRRISRRVSLHSKQLSRHSGLTLPLTERETILASLERIVALIDVDEPLGDEA